jgi:hypothetical protein
MLPTLRAWVRGLSAGPDSHSPHGRRSRIRKTRPASGRLQLEELEAIVVPATLIWDGGGDGTNWSDPNNWDQDQTPTAGDAAILNTGAQVTVGTATASSVTVTSGSINLGSGGALQSSLTLTGGAAGLVGSGLIQGNVLNSGSVRPGNSPGVITINGDYG